MKISRLQGSIDGFDKIMVGRRIQFGYCADAWDSKPFLRYFLGVQPSISWNNLQK